MAQDSRSNPPRANWSILQRKGATYAVSLVDLSPTATRSNSSVSSSNTGGGSVYDTTTYMFTVAPKGLSMDEPAAVQITPTPGGQFIEHQGNIFKNIAISGTTGLRPNPKQAGVIVPVAGILLPGSNLGPASNNGLQLQERTGFDEFISLRNMFRLYWDLKKDPDKAATTVMVWQNGKEGEYFIVEPITFRTNRDSSSPLTFNYDIQLRTIDFFDPSKLYPTSRVDPLKSAASASNFAKRISDIRVTMMSAFTTAQALVDRTVGIANAAVTDVLTPVNQVLNGLANITASGRTALGIPQSQLSVIASSAANLATQLDAVPNNITVEQGIASQVSTAANAYRDIVRQLYRLQNEPGVFVASPASRVSSKAKAYSSSLTGQPLTGGSQTNLTNVRLPNGAAVTSVNLGETIRTIAKRTLGDGAQWKTLVILNALEPPYISASGDGVTVLRPGVDSILYPQATTASTLAATTTQNVVGTQTIADRLGRDILLEASQSAGGITIYDLAKGQDGDLARVEAIANMQQAVMIKLNTEQMELPTHSWFGIRAPIGSKALPQSVLGFYINVRATLLSDSRIESVGQLNVNTDGTVIFVSGAAKVIGSDQQLIFNQALQR